MTWAPVLLADPSPCLRAAALSELFDRSGDPEYSELRSQAAADPLAAVLLSSQQPDGSWKGQGVVRSTAMALMRLGYLGFTAEHPSVRRGAERLFAEQRADGAWPLAREAEEGEGRQTYDAIPLQTAIPLRSLALCGLAEDPRAEQAYEWLLAQRLEDGAWPTGYAAGVFGYVAGYRRLAHSRWGCRSNTTGALACLALHPRRRTEEPCRRGLDLLLGRETRERRVLGFEVARLVGAEPCRGFVTFYARFDAAQILDLCWRIGATRDDPRVGEMVGFVGAAQGEYGLWEYGPRPQASRWVTFDLLRSLNRLDHDGDWVSLEPRTPFQAYPRRIRRY